MFHKQNRLDVRANIGELESKVVEMQQLSATERDMRARQNSAGIASR